MNTCAKFGIRDRVVSSNNKRSCVHILEIKWHSGNNDTLPRLQVKVQEVPTAFVVDEQLIDPNCGATKAVQVTTEKTR